MSDALDLRTRWQVGRVHPTPENEPKGWTLRKLCEVAKLESGHTPSRKRPDYWDGDIPWLSLHDSKEIEGKEIFETQHTVSKLGLDNSSARLLPKGTVALSRTATIGKVAILGREMATSQDFACYICGPDLFNHYLAHLFRGMETEWDRLMAGSTHNTIYMPLFESMQVLVPPLPEQQAIAAALSDADGVVAGLGRVVAKKRMIKQGAMQDLLTARRRLPGYSGEWEVKRLGAALTVRHGRSQKEVEHPSGGFPILATGGQIGTATKFLWDKPSVLIGRKGTIDVPRFMDKPFWSVDTLFYTDVHTGFDAKFLFYVFLIVDWMSYNEASGVPSLNAKTIENIEVSIPKFDEQQAIAAVLSDMDAEIQTLESRLAKARAVKEGMMQNLLTGRVRLD